MSHAAKVKCPHYGRQSEFEAEAVEEVVSSPNGIGGRLSLREAGDRMLIRLKKSILGHPGKPFWGNLMVVFGHAITGITAGTVVRLFGISVPAMVLGTYVGSYFSGMIEEQWYRKMVLAFLTLLGGLMIYKAV